MSVYEINPLTDSRWSELLQHHPSASVFHSKSWLEALSRTYGFEPGAVTTTGPGRPLQNALVFCRVKSLFTGSRIVSLPFSDHCEPLVDSDVELGELVTTAREMVAAKKWNYLELRPVENLNPEVSNRARMVESVSFLLHRLDLRPSEETLFQNLHKSCIQRKVQRANRDGLTSEAGRSPRLLKLFYSLQVLTRRRHQLPPQPIQWFRNLMERFGHALTIRVAFKDGRPIASILTLVDKKTLTYKYGCSDAKFHNLGGMPFLFWQAIQESKREGAEQFDFGRSETDNPGLIAFKGHWGTTSTELKYYRYSSEASGNGANSWRADAARKAFFVLPDFCLSTAGRILYKHNG